jgi:hypothetical protein
MEQKQNGVMTSTKQLTKQIELIIQTFNGDEKRAVYSQYDKKIKDFKDADYNSLHTLLLKWGKFIGLKEVPHTEEMFMLVVFVKENFTKISLMEITNAFNMACAGKLNINVEHYNQFSPIYISKIFNAYGEYKANVIHKLMKAQGDLEESDRNKPLSGNDLEEVSKKNALSVFAQYRMQKKIPDYGHIIYDYFVKKDLIDFTTAQKREILSRAKENSLSDGKKHLRGQRSSDVREKINESLDKIANHDNEKSDLVLKYCKNIGLAMYFEEILNNKEKLAEVIKILNLSSL